MNERRADGYKYRGIDRYLLLAIVGIFAALNLADAAVRMFAEGATQGDAIWTIAMSYAILLVLAVSFERRPAISVSLRRIIQAAAFWTWFVSVLLLVLTVVEQYIISAGWWSPEWHVWAAVWMIAMGMVWWLSR